MFEWPLTRDMFAGLAWLVMIGGYVFVLWYSRQSAPLKRPEVPEPPRVAWRADRSVLDDPEPFGYRVFTRDYDEVVDAASLVRGEDLAALTGLLDECATEHPIAAATDRLAERFGSQFSGSPVAVTLLLDNSGSLRGEAVRVLTATAEILATALDRHQVPLEILGFTTASWKGGQSRTRWFHQGKPEEPGRLCDLRHIVYKPFGTPWLSCRSHLAVMLAKGTLKENIDGEALVWAYRRLIERPEPRRILLVISDGAPVDDSTLQVNPAWYLERHLKHVIEEIERRRIVELAAIGIGHDLSKHYRRTALIEDWPDLGAERVERLADLFLRRE